MHDSLQRKGDIGIAASRTHFAATAGNDDKLSAVDRIGGRRGIAAGGQLGLPQHFSSLLVESPKHLVLGGDA